MAPISEIPEQKLESNTPAPPVVEPIKPGERALTRAVASAVQTLNDAGYAGAGREVTFSLDQATKRPIVKLVDTSTKEVLEQWPAEYLLQLAAEAKKLTRDSG
jgi:flagellar protein FlaG